jgi:hypothetical protein
MVDLGVLEIALLTYCGLVMTLDFIGRQHVAIFGKDN